MVRSDRSSGARGAVPPAMFSESELAKLQEISVAVGLAVPPGFVSLCETFLAELTKWNRKLNLVSRADEKRLVERHLLDSLCLLCLERDLSGRRIVDFGSGAGFPGLVLAMWEPDASVFLVESVSKKVAFLKAAARSVGLRNARAVHSRMEQLSEEAPSGGALPLSNVDVVVSRAVGKTASLAGAAGRLLRSGGVFVLYKGVGASREVSEAARALEETFSVEIVTPPWKTLTRLMVLRKFS